MSTLEEILFDLTQHCVDETGQKSDITVVLPRSVIDRLSFLLMQKERLEHVSDDYRIKKVSFPGGTVQLLYTENFKDTSR